ncbi:MAG: CC/Se motif family (seleno)protein [Clostridia bacterium]
MQSPAVRLGKPEKIESFDLYQVDETSVYLRKGIEVIDEQIHIFMRKFLFIKDLAVDGMRINYF